ncbi:DUF2569 family protein [Bradyrhizobium cosmicum]|uniref:DUF2569 family protein n=1 Tax=Bradyrhizobium cosmicum TaxID=1404864 RepID=UPI0028E3BCD2|nr:DUF2569 family protein [Bradyrhizobium cosmicum]
MTDLWYYAEGEETRGPLAIDQLIPLLLRISDPRRIMIWRHGFEDWKPVEDVREVAQQVLGPPPLKPKPPPIPPKQTPLAREPVVDAEDAAYFKDVKPELTGLGGWLALVGFGQVAGILRFIVSIGEYYSRMDNQLFAKFPTTMWGEAVMNGGLIWLFAYTTLLFFRRSRNFPLYFVFQFVAAIFAPIVALLWAAFTIALATGTPILDYLSLDPKDGGQLIAAMIGAAIWIPYIRKSRRVANTFTQ